MKKYFIFILFVFAGKSGQSQGNPTDIPALLFQLAKSRPDTQRISICVNLAGCYLVPGRSVNRMDSVTLYLNKAKELNTIFGVAAFRNRINLFSALRDYILLSSEDPKTIFLPVIDSCKKTGDKFNEAQAWMYLGSKIEEDPQNYPFKLACHQSSFALMREIDESFMEWKPRVSIAHVHILQENFDQAERELLQVLEQYRSIRPVVEMHAYDGLTFLYLSKGQLNKALDYALKTQKMMGTTGDSTSAALYHHRLVWLYRSLARDKERQFWEKKELEFTLATNNIPGVYTNVADLGGMMRELGKPQEALEFLRRKLAQKEPDGINDKRRVQQFLGGIYTSEKKYNLAEKCYREMIRLGSLQKHRFSVWDRAFNNFIVGRFYYDRGLYSKARPFLETSVKDYEAYSVLPYRRRNHLLLFKTDSSLGNYTEAISHLNEANRIGDSIFNKERNRQIEELQIAYQTEQKDKDIRILEEKEKFSRIQLQNAQSTRNWIVAGALMLLIIAGLLFAQGEVRKKNTRIIRIKNNQLQHLVTEKDWLVKEIHHRVKNNFQTVMGLLGTQSAYLKNDIAINAINDSQRRIQSMSLIHQRLYQSNNLSTINMKDYIHELVNSLSEGFNTSGHVRFYFDIEPVELDLAHCIPLGLILNEAITNSFKYAFLDKSEGKIHISLKNGMANNFLLIIKDDGVGLPDAFDVSDSHTMGMNLMRGLCAEIRAQFTISGANGTTVSIHFSYHPQPVTMIADTELPVSIN